MDYISRVPSPGDQIPNLKRKKTFLAGLVMLALLFLFHRRWIGRVPANADANLLIPSLCWFFEMLLALILAARLFSVKPSSRRPAMLLFGVLAIAGLGFLSAMLARADLHYDLFKESGRGWDPSIYRSDPTYGYANRENYEGDRMMPLQLRIPVFTDQQGFRVSGDTATDSAKAGPKALFLGGSFTFGDVCDYHDTFVHKAERGFGKTFNAGVCGYGWAQMLLQAEALLPELSPDILVVQVSPWLLVRSISPYSPSAVGRVPVPFLAVDDGELIINPPVYRTAAFRLPVHRFTLTKKKWYDRIGYYITAGVPMNIYDFFQHNRYRIREYTGRIIQQKASEAEQVIPLYIERMRELCDSNQTKLVLLYLDNGEKSSMADQVAAAGKEELLVDAEAGLWAAINDPQNVLSYDELFHHWAYYNGKSNIYDFHPNATAHSIIAEELLNALESH